MNDENKVASCLIFRPNLLIRFKTKGFFFCLLLNCLMTADGFIVSTPMELQRKKHFIYFCILSTSQIHHES